MSDIASQVTTRDMVLNDVDKVVSIENQCFPTPWSPYAFCCEILDNTFANYLVLVNGENPEDILGYAGMWVILDEAHVTNIAIDPQYRGKRLGEFLLLSLIERALKKGATAITLEVRVSNASALKLYEKIGFTKEGIRKGYYQDNNEDAIIMWKKLLKRSGDTPAEV